MSFSTFPNNPFPPSTAQFDEGKNNDIQAEIDAIKDGTNIDSFADVESALATKTNLSNIAPAFDATSGVYAVGDKVIYDGVLYEFTSAHSTAGEWDESEVQPVKVSELVDSLKNGLINKVEMKTTQDLNSANTTGVYFFTFNAQNVPSPHSGTVLTLTDVSGETGMQIARVTTENTVYVRFCDNSTWTAWKQLAFTA